MVLMVNLHHQNELILQKISPDTALRDIQDLISKGILQKEAQGGRSANYELLGI